jgi:molybdopterin-guanine dinucleotide biosynthesis protein A
VFHSASGSRLTPETNPKVFGYVLAGGGSTRLGRDKALVPFGGTPLLLRIVSVLADCAGDVAVIAASQKYRELDQRLHIVEDRWPGEGPLGGIITALQNTAAKRPSTKWNVVISCDMPFVSPEWLSEMIRRAHSAAPEVQVVLPHSAHGPEPLCACYRTDAADALKNAFDGGVRRVTQALKQVRTEVLDESAWKRFDSAGRLFWNMNTPEDSAEAQRFWNAEHGPRSNAEGRCG